MMAAVTDLTIDGPHGPLPAYLATPKTPGPWPGVVVIHDLVGFTSDVKRHADWLAEEGYLAVAPNLFSWDSWRKCLKSSFKAVRSREGKNQLEYRICAPNDQLLAKDHSPPMESPAATPSVPSVAARGPTNAVSPYGSRSALTDQESLTTTIPMFAPPHHSQVAVRNA